jgi:hypothetical protein
MQETHCPVCFGELEARELGPCDDCGADPKELEHFRQGAHTYSVYAVFAGIELTLCNLCHIDFASHKPDFFGLSKGQRIDPRKMNFVRSVDEPSLQMGKVCTQCGLRLSFARFVAQVRELNANGSLS